MTARQRDRWQRLVEAALAALAEQDYDEIQVKEIADRAGVSYGTLYNYFSSKERLFAAAVARWAEEFPATIEKRPLTGASPFDRFGEAVQRGIRAFERFPHVARFINVLVTSSDAFALETLRRMDEAATEVYVQALAPIAPLRARSIVAVVQAVFSVALREWSFGRMGLPEVHQRLASAIEITTFCPSERSA
jgi:AcrR family transcriptional regulator